MVSNFPANSVLLTHVNALASTCLPDTLNTKEKTLVPQWTYSGILQMTHMLWIDWTQADGGKSRMTLFGESVATGQE